MEEVFVRVVSDGSELSSSHCDELDESGDNEKKAKDENQLGTGNGEASEKDDSPPGTTRRNSSIGVSLMTDCGDYSAAFQEGTGRPSFASNASFAAASMSRASDLQFASMQDDRHQYRPLVGSGAAAAYEALRHDFYVQKQRKQQQRRMSSLSFGSAKAPAYSPGRQTASREEQYEMLKLHHLNLMNEIQETALMLNLYEQQQLLLQQKQRQEQMRVGQFAIRSQSTGETSMNEKKREAISLENSSSKRPKTKEGKST